MNPWRRAGWLTATVLSLSSMPAKTEMLTAQEYRTDVVDSAAVVVATTLAMRSGSADDPAGLEGLTHVIAEAHRTALERVPGVLGVEAEVTRASVSWTVVSTPDAAGRVLSDIRSVDVMTSGLPEALDEARRRFLFTAATPATEVDVEAARLFTGFGSAWARPVRGTGESVAAIGTASARDRWDDLLSGALALVRVGPPGAVSPADPTPGAGPVPADASPPPIRTGLPWTQGDRLAITREVTNVWIVAAFPVPADLGRTSLDHLVHRIDEILNPTPPEAGIIGAGVALARLPEGQAIVIRATVLPSSAGRWEERIRTIPSGITPPFDPEFFRWERRRFRAHLLLRDALPTERSRRIAGDLLGTGSVRTLADEAWSLEPDDLAEAASRLGPPRILVLGAEVGGPDSIP
jgi:hypothetical protein